MQLRTAWIGLENAREFKCESKNQALEGLITTIEEGSIWNQSNSKNKAAKIIDLARL